MRIGKVVSSFSLFVVASFGFCALDYRALSDVLNVDNATSIAQTVGTYPEVPDQLRVAAQKILRTSHPTEAQVQEFKSFLEMAQIAEVSTSNFGKSASIRGKAQAIKDDIRFSRPSDKQNSNWIAKAFERLSQIDVNSPRMDPVPVGKPPSLDFLLYIMWAILALAVLTLLFLAIRAFSWRRNLSRKVSAILEDDEPTRTVDEWLELADSLIGQGKYREAIRCLYLACLLRFDEKGIARFDRSQTNWEHLKRIRVSPKLPSQLNFEPATKLFDVIWYGKRTARSEDVELFHSWYEDLLKQLKGVA